MYYIVVGMEQDRRWGGVPLDIRNGKYM